MSRFLKVPALVRKGAADVAWAFLLAWLILSVGVGSSRLVDAIAAAVTR